MAKRKHHTTLDWAVYDNKKIPIFYDEYVTIINAPSDYMRRTILDPVFRTDTKTATKKTYFLSTFFEWSYDVKHVNWEYLTDDLLEEFKNYYTAKIINANKRGTTERSAKQTVNHCLRTLYAFYTWCQENNYTDNNTIGYNKDSRITSSLPYKYAPNTSVDPKDFHPLIYKGVGESSRTNPNSYFLSQDDILMLADYLSSSRRSDASIRNLLILAIANEMGWRVESIASLTIDDFSADKLQDINSDYILVTPKTQKFNYKKPFKVPYKLYLRINRYINTERLAIMKKNDWTESKALNAVFINLNSGTRLTSQSMSEIFTDACVILGLPPGSGIHAIRRKVGQDISDATVNAAFENGETPRQEDVEFQAMQKLGHNDISSQTRYRNSLTAARSKTNAWEHYERLKEAERKVLEQQSEIAKLTKELKANKDENPTHND